MIRENELFEMVCQDKIFWNKS